MLGGSKLSFKGGPGTVVLSWLQTLFPHLLVLEGGLEEGSLIEKGV